MSIDPHYRSAGTLVAGDRSIGYEFRLDLFPVRSATRTTLGEMSVFSYFADATDDERAERPVVFAFNGGPGCSSAFLHMSGLAPMRAAVPVDLSKGALPPYSLEPSPHSLLDVADLVFLDPVGTGYGRAAADVDVSALHSVIGDARSFADTIETWIAEHGRWNSPKYILGESYGTHRAPFLAMDLLTRKNVAVDGLVFIGQALNVQDTLDRPGNLAGAMANISLKAATAWFHGIGGRAHETVEEAVDAAMEFAHGDFATALLRGNRRTAAETAAIAGRLAEVTGGSADRYIAHSLWETKPDYLSTVLPGRALGISDTRYVAPSAATAYGESAGDPSEARVDTAFAVGVKRHVADALGVPSVEDYVVIDWDGSSEWRWSDEESAISPFHTFAYPAQLTTYLREVPDARLFIATGLYDGQATIGAAEHLIRHYPIPQDRVTHRWYRGGHMLYSDPGAAASLTEDLRAFVGSTN